MPTAPYGVRLLVGAAVTAIEETRRLPQTIVMYPMTLVSTLAQAVMKFQQDLADLAIKGDSALGSLFPPTEEQPDWATFDEDVAPNGPRSGTERRTGGRFALYSVTDVTAPAEDGPAPGAKATKQATKSTARKSPAAKTAKTAKASKPAGAARPAQPAGAAKARGPVAEPPPVAAELDYDSLTLAQLRARMPGLSVADLRALLAYEEAGKARAPFQTLLANRITRATAK
jgi:hypothetical protein